MIRIRSENYTNELKNFENSRVSVVSYDETLSRFVLRLFNEKEKLFLFIILLGTNKMRGCFRWRKSNLIYKHPSNANKDYACLIDNSNDFEVIFNGGIFMIKGDKAKLSPEDFIPDGTSENK